MFTAAQIRPGASWQLDNFLRPQGAFPPGFYLLREPVRWGVHQIPQYHNTAPIQLSGRTSSAVFTAAQLRPGASWQLVFLRVHFPAPEAPLTRGMPTGPRAFLANSGRVWATALHPVPPKKRPCAIHARKVGRASNTAVS